MPTWSDLIAGAAIIVIALIGGMGRGKGGETRMSREIKFRGKRIDNGEWVCGSLIETNVIVDKIVEFTEEYFYTEWWCKVDPETVGQYTGLKDKNGREIYEGDILRAGDPVYVAEVVYDDHFGAWGLCRDDVMSCHVGDFDESDREVIGNIHEHPHLLEGGATK